MIDLEPGETLFTPGGCMHAVMNLTQTIAVTGNWINEFCCPETFDILGTDLLCRGSAITQAQLDSERLKLDVQTRQCIEQRLRTLLHHHLK